MNVNEGNKKETEGDKSKNVMYKPVEKSNPKAGEDTKHGSKEGQMNEKSSLKGSSKQINGGSNAKKVNKTASQKKDRNKNMFEVLREYDGNKNPENDLQNKVEEIEEEDVFECSGMANIAMDFRIRMWNVRGMSTSDKQNEVAKFINDENLQGCRIIVGWNRDLKFVADLNRHKQITIGKPWMIGGDMNVILNTNEHSAGVSFVSSEMQDFKDCINMIEVEDFCSSGLFFTWTKNLKKARAGDETGVLKLDRVMVNEDFMKKYVQAHVIFNPYLVSDHSQAILIFPNGMKRKKKAFKFANFVADKEYFIPMVEKEWKIKVDGFQMFQLMKKMRNLKIHLRKLSWQNGNLFEKVEKVRENLKNIQRDIDRDPYNKTLRDEEGRYQRNRIERIQDVNGNSFEGQEVANQFVLHFKKILGHRHVVKEIDKCCSLFKNKVNEAEALSLVKDVSLKEIKDALFDIGDNKAPGPDCFSSVFFKKAWNVIVITGRLKKVLRKLVNINQSTFVAGRQIQDNILLTQELLKGYGRKGGPTRVAFKIDIQKAYDTVNESFLETILTYFGLPGKMIQWIMMCVKTTSFTINVNGELCGFFKGERGLRQGDPMSSYLFTLVMECFTLMMEKNVQRNPNFQFHFGCKGMKLTHVCFADDLLVLCHGDVESVTVVRDTIDEFSKCSGLLPNFYKSTIFFRSVKDEIQKEILEILPFEKGKLPMKYLGVHLTTKRLGIKNCKCLVDKVRSSIFNWKNKCLSYAGRLQLIASILESIQVSVDSNDSWGWKNLLKISDEISKHVWYKLGDGMNNSIWYDNWCEKSPLCRIISNRSIYSARLSRDMMITDIVNNGNWNWPSEWMIEYPFLRHIKTPKLNTWKRDWLGYDESHDHLFFNCQFSQAIWKDLKPLMLFKSNSNRWNDIIEELAGKLNNSGIWSIVRRLCLAGAVYAIWRERNNKIFRDEECSWEVTLKMICETVRLRLMGLNVKDSMTVQQVAVRWNVNLKTNGKMSTDY
ncbi:RNA-directed DNA polymerase, eukaryota, reverse transcriptase zinc-binding domain protein [Tanacetum coccineum]